MTEDNELDSWLVEGVFYVGDEPVKVGFLVGAGSVELPETG